MDGGEQLTSLRGMRFKETILTAESRATPFRHFGIPPGQDSEPPLGPLALLSFLAPTPANSELSTSRDCKSYLRNTLTTHFNSGLFLHTKEKGVTFPVIHFTDDRDSLKKRLSDEDVLGNEYLLYQGVYREVRSIRPEGVALNGRGNCPESTAYIVMGFKSLDKNFSQMKLLDFAQRLRGERMTGYVSVYGVTLID